MSSEFLYSITPVEKHDNGNKYLINVEVPLDRYWYDDMYIVIEKGNEKIPVKLNHKENRDGKIYFEGEVFLDTRAIYRYYFSYYKDGKLCFHKKKDIVKHNPIRDEMFKMSVNYDVPDWAKGKIMYHIFVDRFNRGSSEKMVPMDRRNIHEDWNESMQIGPDKDGIWNNDFYGGDLKGIIDKLDYIESLGVSILYLSPIVWSQSNHRYDTSDYEKVDPYAGVNEDLKLLCDEAHKRGMKVVLDAVFNHTGSDSKYFNKFGNFDEVGAYQSNDSKYSSFFRKHYHNGKEYFDYWWGFDNLPECNGNSFEWREYILGEGGVIDLWFSLGIDGLRLDVADELTDDFIEGIRTAVKRNKEDGFILGEVWKNPMRMGRGYIESGRGMDSVMNYPLVDALLRYFKYGDVHKLSYIINDMLNEYPEDTIYALMNFTSTHDISRALNMLGCDHEFSPYKEWYWDPVDNSHEHCKDYKMSKEDLIRAKEIYKAYISALAFLPGNLSIFYGDEAGIEGLGNLANRKTFPWGEEDSDLVEFFTSIGKVRVNNKFLEQADLNVFKINRDYFMFERVSGEDKMLFAVNRTDNDVDFKVPDEYSDGEDVYVLKKSRKGHLGPYGSVAIKK